MKIIKCLYCIFCGLIVSGSVQAQKLPTIQKKSIGAPANFKADGNPAEWGNKLKAYNVATAISYTMANDSDNLYLIIRTDDQDALMKITNRGILLSINKTGKKTDKDVMSITYPIFEMGNRPYISFKHKPQIIPGNEASVKNADSVMNEANKRIHKMSKFIKVEGIPGVDVMLSIYNEEGILAGQAFDNTMTYTYELAIPLKLLKFDVKNNASFSYHIILQGINAADFGLKLENLGHGTYDLRVPPEIGDSYPDSRHLNAVRASTDFWGTYILIKR